MPPPDVAAPDKIFCYKMLISPAVTAFAWTRKNRLAPVLNYAQKPITSHLEISEGWVAERETQIVPLRLQFDAQKTVLGPHAAWLPAELREILERNGRFQTSRESHSPFALWMMVPPGGLRGRSGILLYEGRPVLIRNPQTGAEYFVEFKGAGLPRGGYLKSADYRALQGGLWELHGRLEYERLRKFEKRDEGVLGLGYQEFTGEHGPQELLMRLTPGNLRASFNGLPHLVPRKTQARALILNMGRRMGELLAQGYGAATHPENFVVDHRYRRAFLTDYLDVMPLWDWNLWANSFDARWDADILAHTLNFARWSHGYPKEDGQRFFYEGVREALIDAGYPADQLQDLWDPDRPPAFGRIWNAGLAARIFQDRRLHGVTPFDDKQLEEALTRPCTEAPRDVEVSSVRERIEHALWTGDALKDLPVRAAKTYLAYLDRKISFDEFMNDPDTQAVHNYLRRLRFRPVRAARKDERESPLRRYLREPKKDIILVFRTAFPGLMHLRNFIERETDLLRGASAYDPNLPGLARARQDLDQLKSVYKKTSLDEFRRMICEDREAFRRLFHLSYYEGI